MSQYVLSNPCPKCGWPSYEYYPEEAYMICNGCGFKLILATEDFFEDDTETEKDKKPDINLSGFGFDTLSF